MSYQLVEPSVNWNVADKVKVLNGHVWMSYQLVKLSVNWNVADKVKVLNSHM